jgi:hypothetical protein
MKSPLAALFKPLAASANRKRRPVGVWVEFDLAKSLHLREQGWSNRRIAQKMNVSKDTVRRRLAEHDVLPTPAPAPTPPTPCETVAPPSVSGANNQNEAGKQSKVGQTIKGWRSKPWTNLQTVWGKQSKVLVEAVNDLEQDARSAHAVEASKPWIGSGTSAAACRAVPSAKLPQPSECRREPSGVAVRNGSENRTASSEPPPVCAPRDNFGAIHTHDRSNLFLVNSRSQDNLEFCSRNDQPAITLTVWDKTFVKLPALANVKRLWVVIDRADDNAAFLRSLLNDEWLHAHALVTAIDNVRVVTQARVSCKRDDKLFEEAMEFRRLPAPSDTAGIDRLLARPERPEQAIMGGTIASGSPGSNPNPSGWNPPIQRGNSGGDGNDGSGFCS